MLGSTRQHAALQSTPQLSDVMSNVWVKLSEIEERLQTVVTMTSSMCGTSIDAVTPAVDVVLLAVICTRELSSVGLLAIIPNCAHVYPTSLSDCPLCWCLTVDASC